MAAKKRKVMRGLVVLVRGLAVLLCLRCGYEWVPRSAVLPQRCSRCNSPYWNKERQERA